MALVAGLREIRGHVVRIRGALIVLEVATHTGGRRQVVVVVDMAVGALTRRHGVQASEREAGAVVVECRVQPG